MNAAVAPYAHRPGHSPTRRGWTSVAVLFSVLLLATSSLAEPLLLSSRTLEPTAATAVPLSELVAGVAGDGRHVLIQLARIPDATERNTLSARGLVLLHYIPVNGYLAWVSREAATDPALDAWVTWSAPIPVADKTSEMIREGVTPPYARSSDGRLDVVVYLFPDVSPQVGRQVVEARGAEVLRSYPEFARLDLRVPDTAVPVLASADEVRWIRHASPPAVDDVDGGRVRHTVDEVQAVPYGLTGVGTSVGVIESGSPDITHDDLAGRVTRIQTPATSQHATHVTGLAIGDGTLSVVNGGTALQWRGMATAGEAVSWRSGSGHLTPYGTAIGTHDIDAATNSWGWQVSSGLGNCSIYGNYSDGAREHDQIITGLHGKRIPIFFSAGNERNNCDCGMSCASPYINYTNIRPPGATSKNTMTIGAQPSNRRNVTDFSSWGPMDDGRLKPEIVASGDEVFPTPDGGITAAFPGDTYGVLAGTSMSTPIAAGSAGLFIEDFRSLTAVNPQPATVKAHFVHTAADLDRENISYTTIGPDFASGYGSLRMQACIDQLRSGDWVEGSVDQGGSEVYLFTVPGDATIMKATLAWDDPAGAQNANPALVNDLDLVVTGPDLARYYPWTLDPLNPGDAAVRTQEDHTNNLEQVYADSTDVEGQWTIEVRGTAVPTGPQSFSLVFSHDGAGVVDAPVIGQESTLRTVVLHPSHPNPFRPWTAISYSLTRAQRVALRVLDIQGRVVRTLVEGERQAEGGHTYTWRGRDDSGRSVASGVYLVQLRAGEERITRKVTLLR